MQKGSKFAAALAAGVCAIGAAGCSRASEPELGPPHVVEAPRARFGATTAERFGFSQAPRAAQPQPAEAAFAYELPAGWVERAPTSMRVVNLGIEREPRAEVALTLLGGDGGGLAENVRRWRGQLGLGALSDAELAALPKSTLLGRDAVLFDASGAYAGMGGAAQPGFRMLGLLSVQPEGSAFLKFTGPEELVAAEAAAFEAFAASLRAAGAQAAAPAAPATASSATSGTADEPRDGLRWRAPAGWNRAPDRAMRTVTYLAGPDGAVECYVAVLGGEAGGVRSNLDRWSGQMGGAPLTDAEFDDLERVPSALGEAVLIEVPGGYRGMSGEVISDALMLGAVVQLGQPGAIERTVFVKLVGPRAAAEAEAAAFRAFVASLEEAP